MNVSLDTLDDRKFARVNALGPLGPWVLEGIVRGGRAAGLRVKITRWPQGVQTRTALRPQSLVAGRGHEPDLTSEGSSCRWGIYGNWDRLTSTGA